MATGTGRLRSASPAFRRAFALDVKTMPARLRTQLDYFLQTGDGGPQEAFAEAFAVVLGGGSATSLQREFKAAFPRVLTWMERALERRDSPGKATGR